MVEERAVDAELVPEEPVLEERAVDAELVPEEPVLEERAVDAELVPEEPVLEESPVDGAVAEEEPVLVVDADAARRGRRRRPRRGSSHRHGARKPKRTIPGRGRASGSSCTRSPATRRRSPPTSMPASRA